MKVIASILLCHVGWLSATLLIYPEASIKEFGSTITASKISFGYSITYTPDNKRLIVSAPKATDHGALFSCNINGSDCTSIFIDTKDIKAPKNYHIWLGATVRAGSNFFMTCAPRYRIKVDNSSFANSQCYKYANSGKYRLRFMPLTSVPQSKFASIKLGEHKMLSFGWSMDIDENNNALIGGPAMFTGRAVYYDYNKMKSPDLITPGKQEAPFLKTNFGYSVLHRKYNSQMQIIVSSTYGENGKGMVVLFNNTNWVISKLRGTQVGAMFGASLCAARVDSKGQALLLVGAPTYTRHNLYNTGAVLIYMDEDINVYNTIKGTGNGGHFGYALANLGDLNGDDKDEIAISAPYENEGQGAVYIYSGAQLLDRDKEVTWLQKIQRSEYRSFGLSLYAIPDSDQNGCKELAIGIPENNRAVLFSCLATITATLKKIRPKRKINDTPGLSSFLFESCLALQYPELPKAITASFSVDLDIPDVLIKLLSATGPSANDSISYNINVTDKKQEYCKEIVISVPTDKIYDPTRRYQISAVLLNDPKDPKNMKTFDPSRVTVSDLSRLTLPGTIWIGECKNGDRCVPKLEMDLYLSVTNSTYVVGSTNVETMSVYVHNTGDPAYDACVRVLLTGVNLLSWPPPCVMPPDVRTRDMLICKPIRLLRNNTAWDIEEIKLDMKSIKGRAERGGDTFDVQVQLFEVCNTISTTQNMTRQLHWDSEHISAMGLIKNGGVINITKNEIESSSKQIQHEYKITNNGPTTWTNVRVTISLQKELYLDGISATSGEYYKCTPGEKTEKEYINHCVISFLKNNTELEIVQPIDVTSKIYETLKKRPLKVTTTLNMILYGDEKFASVVTTLRFYEIEVATWIIVVAILFGLLIIIIMIFILYESGFLRRKKKDDLTHLRRSVQRQSMRRTTMIQHTVDISDNEKLIENADEAKPDNETASTLTTVQVNEKVDINTHEDNKNEVPAKNCEEKQELGEDIETSVSSTNINSKDVNAAEIELKAGKMNEKDEEDTKGNIKPKNLKAEINDPIAGIIIGGLQKNIRHRGVPTNVEDDRLVE